MIKFLQFPEEVFLNKIDGVSTKIKISCICENVRCLYVDVSFHCLLNDAVASQMISE
jgi:hypothetical protein